MSKTTFSNKCRILGELWMWYKDTDNEAWAEFFSWADIGCPLSYNVWQGLANATTEGKEIINNTWDVFCEMIEIDIEGKYTNLSDAFAASPNAELE